MGHVPAKLGSGGEVRRQLPPEAQGLGAVLLRLLEPAHRAQQLASVTVAQAQYLAEVRSGGEVGRQLLPDAHGLVEVLLGLLKFTQPLPHLADSEASLRPRGPAVGVLPLDGRKGIVLRDDAAQESSVVFRQDRPLGELPLHHVRGHAPQGGERLLPGFGFILAGLLFRFQGGILGIALLHGLQLTPRRPGYAAHQRQ